LAQDGTYALGGTSSTTITACRVRMYNVQNCGFWGDLYCNDEDRKYTVISSSGSILNVNMTFQYMQNGFDFVYVYDGPSTASPLIASWTGDNTATAFNGKILQLQEVLLQ